MNLLILIDFLPKLLARAAVGSEKELSLLSETCTGLFLDIIISGMLCLIQTTFYAYLEKGDICRYPRSLPFTLPSGGPLFHFSLDASIPPW